MMIMKDKFKKAQWDKKKFQNSFGPTAYKLTTDAWELTAGKVDDSDIYNIKIHPKERKCGYVERIKLESDRR